MMLDFACSGCGQKYRVDIGLSGRQIRCKKCGEAVTVPSPNAVAPIARPAATSRAVTTTKPASRPPLQSFGDEPRPQPATSRPPQRPSKPRDEEYDYDLNDAEEPDDAVADPYGIDDEYAPPISSHDEVAPDDDDEFGVPRRGGIGKGKSRKTEPAGFWKRFVALFIDYFVLMVIGVLSFIAMVVIIIVARFMGVRPEGNEMLIGYSLFALMLGGYCLYSAGMTSSSQQATLGKMAMGLIVTDMNGRRLTFGRALGRELAKIFISGIVPFALGFLMAAFNETKQALHDKIAGTLVRKKS